MATIRTYHMDLQMKNVFYPSYQYRLVHCFQKSTVWKELLLLFLNIHLMSTLIWKKTLRQVDKLLTEAVSVNSHLWCKRGQQFKIYKKKKICILKMTVIRELSELNFFHDVTPLISQPVIGTILNCRNGEFHKTSENTLNSLSTITPVISMDCLSLRKLLTTNACEILNSIWHLIHRSYDH